MAHSPIASITWSASQADSDVSFYFADAGEKFRTDEGKKTAVEMNDFVQSQIANIFATISEVSNLTFTEGGRRDSDLRILLTDLKGDDDGFMSPPEEPFAGVGVFDAKKDALFETGAYNYMVMVHEIMHGLGLAHPHDDGGGSTIMDGVTDSFDSFGDFGLNQGVFTVMTYNNGYPLGTAAPKSSLFGYETGPMALDIAVLQEKYGANMTHATGDDSYSLVGQKGAGTGWAAIWDAGGTDEIVYDGDIDATIDLRSANLQYKNGGGGFVSSVDGIAGGFTIAKGVRIENATGGSGDDWIRGNAGDNLLDGGMGRDKLIGGKGADIFVFGATDQIKDFATGEDMIDLGGAEAKIIERDNGRFAIRIDIDGDGHFDDGRMISLHEVTHDDFIL